MAEAFNFDRLASVAPAAHRLHEAALVAFYLNGLPGTKNANRDRVAVIDAMFRQIASDLGYEVVRKPDAERIREFRDDVKAFISDHDHGLGPDVARLRSAVPSFDALPA